MPRKNKLIIRSGTAAPTASDFVAGEPAWDATNSKLYIKNTAGTMVDITGTGGAASVVEYATTASFPATGAAATLYLATDSRRLYSWTGSVYAEVGAVSAYDSRWDSFLPPAPTGVTGTASNAQVALSWTAPTASAQTPITSYAVQYSSNSGSTWTTFGTAPTTNSVTVTGLTNGTAYTFRVAATNAIGTGSYSSASASITPIAGDLYFDNVRLLLHADGANSGTTFTDTSYAARTVTRGGSAVTSTAAKKFGTASAYFAASGDYLSLADANALELGSSDFAIEMWINTTSSTQYATIISRTPGSFSSGMWSLLMNHASATSGDLALYVADVSIAAPTVSSTGGNSLRDGAWHHIAISRSGSTWNMYIDGTRVGTATVSATVANISGGINIGRDEFYGRQFVGYIDDARITIGSARGYTGASITVPVAAFPDVGTAAFSPASLSPTLWLDASVSASLYNATSGGSLAGSGAQVLRWEDQSGNGNHVTGINGPTRSVASINSRDSLAFSSQLLTRSTLNLSSATEASLFAVIKFATSGNQIAVAFGTDASYGALAIEANLRSAGQHSATFGNNSLASENQATGGTVTNVTKSFGAVYGSSTGTLYIGGSSAATVSRSQALNSGSGFSVGAYFSSGYSLSGNICEIVYVPAALTAAQISSLQSYFAAKWGV